MNKLLQGIRHTPLVMSMMATVATASFDTLAQNYPSKPIKLIVAFPPGTPPDVVGRVAAERLSGALGQQVVVENKPGVGGTLGAAFAAGAPADGYTLLLASTGTLAVGPALYAKVSFDPVKAFAPISLLGTSSIFLTINTSVPAANVREFIDHVRERPRQVHYASIGNGSVPHIVMEMFKSAAAKQGVTLDLGHVPFKTPGDAHNALVNGTVQAMVDQVATIAPHLRSGKLRPLAVFRDARAPQMPDVPTMAEAGVHDLHVDTWFGLVAPRGTPDDIVQRLNGVTREALNAAQLRERLARFGFDPVSNTPEQFGTIIANDVVKWGQAVRASGARVD